MEAATEEGMMGSGSPFEGMPGGIGEQNGMIRLPYHP